MQELYLFFGRGYNRAVLNFIQTASDSFHITLSPAQQSAFALYERELLEWNSRFNLTAIRNSDEIYLKHFLDSLSCLPVMTQKSCQRVVDVGTGAGFPGIPLKILLTDMQLTLVEAVGKKTTFCSHLVQVLGLLDVQVIHARAEELGQQLQHRQAYDWAVARALAAMPVLAEYLLPLVRVGGSMLAQKGASAPEETREAEAAIKVLGGKLNTIHPVQLPGIHDERYLVVIDKIASTPSKYPRRPGVPAAQPLR